MTVIVPVMNVWMAHSYEYEPTLVKVKLNDAPGTRFPEFHAAGPETEVQVWVVVSWLVTVTVVPTGKVIDWGLKAKLLIERAIGLGGAVVGGDVVGGTVRTVVVGWGGGTVRTVVVGLAGGGPVTGGVPPGGGPVTGGPPAAITRSVVGVPGLVVVA